MANSQGPARGGGASSLETWSDRPVGNCFSFAPSPASQKKITKDRSKLTLRTVSSFPVMWKIARRQLNLI